MIETAAAILEAKIKAAQEVHAIKEGIMNGEVSPLAYQNELIRNMSLETMTAKNETFLESPAFHRMNIEKNLENQINECREKPQIEINRENGSARETMVQGELEKQYPENEGYQIFSQPYLRDSLGEYVKDSISGERRRLDFVVADKNGQILKSIEVTSHTAPKEIQSAKETRIREQGGNFIKNIETGEILEIPKDIRTEIWRR